MGKGESQKALERYESKYKEQQRVTIKMTGEKKGNWERYKIEETKTNGKQFWNLIKDILAKMKIKDKEAYIYTEDGKGYKIENMWSQFMEAWKEGIYQKTSRIDLTFWYGRKDSRGKKFKMTEEKETNNKIMKELVITEEEMLEIVDRQRTGKAAGVDGINAEVMKHLIKK